MENNNVTISLSEYRDLLLKERPNDNDKWLLEKIKNFIAQNAKLNRDCNFIEIGRYDGFEEKILEFIKNIDFEFYKTIVKQCYDMEMEKEEAKLRVEKMNAIKELNKEVEKKEKEHE